MALIVREAMNAWTGYLILVRVAVVVPLPASFFAEVGECRKQAAIKFAAERDVHLDRAFVPEFNSANQLATGQRILFTTSDFAKRTGTPPACS